jgi:hypothetical protein
MIQVVLFMLLPEFVDLSIQSQVSPPVIAAIITAKVNYQYYYGRIQKILL